ncbi:hypothetical protein ACFL19_00735 [Pseudomonadota bacterium]
MGDNELEFIINLVNSHSIGFRNSETNALCSCIKLISESFTRNSNPKPLVQNLIYIRSFYCQHHTLTAAVRKYYDLKSLARQLVKKGFLVADGPLPLGPRNAVEYGRYKETIIPKKILDKITVSPSADDIFDEVLATCSPPEIARRLKERVNSFKHKKQHRNPLVLFLMQISETSPDWHKHEKIIQGELLKYRNNMLDHFDRNTAYGRYQNVKNAFAVLIEHQLLPNSIELPGNLRRCSRTQRVRSENPVISDLNIYDENQKKTFINSRTFLNDFKNDIAENLNLLVTTAQRIVYDAYHQFLSKEDIVERSQVQEFIRHPRLLVKNTGTRIRQKKELNPFYDARPLFFENRLAALDHFFDRISNNNPLPSVNYLSCHRELLGYLGLTPTVASAMQVVIVDELGINPYSLYKVKISSDGHGHEFVQVTDKGSVRLKALKPRARKVRSNHAHSANISLSATEPHEIDAATCLKMALEMTSRTRKSVNKQDLWLCLTRNGAIAPGPETFQNKFKILRGQVSSVKPVLSKATLKKNTGIKSCPYLFGVQWRLIEDRDIFGQSGKNHTESLHASIYHGVGLSRKNTSFPKHIAIHGRRT